jgi:hypothetical protein
MKKLKLEKINLSEMTLDEMNTVKGGDEDLGFTWKLVCKSLIKYSCAACKPSYNPKDCSLNLSCRPGTQESCGLCNTYYAC